MFFTVLARISLKIRETVVYHMLELGQALKVIVLN
jgi:hypothetical protein